MRVVALVSIVVALVTISAIAVLVWPAPVFPLIDTASKLEALKTALAIGAGAAGIATLLLAASKQVHHEKTSLANELDATERRITDLYSKSVDQLGPIGARYGSVASTPWSDLLRIIQGNGSRW